MKKNIRNLCKKAVCAAVVMSLGLLTACGSGNAGDGTKSETKTAGADAPAGGEGASGAQTASGTINFYYWDGGQTEAVENLISLFKEQHPQIEVIPTQIPTSEYWTKLQTSLPNGTGPDVFWMNMTAPDYFNAGLLYDMGERIKADNVDMSVFPSLLTNLYIQGEAVYAIPKDYDGIALFYNKAVFDEMGLEYPKDGMSWDELSELAQKATNDQHYGFVAQNAGNVCYQDFIYSNGGRISAADSAGCEINQPEAVEAIQYLHDMMYKTKVSPTYSEQLEFSPNDMFVSGQAAMITAGSWKMTNFAENLGEDLGICTMPVAKTPAITASGLGYCINAASANIDASWEFVKFCATRDGQAATVSGAIPAYSGCDQLWVENFSQYEDAPKILEGINYEGSLPNPWWDKGYNDAKNIITETMTTIWSEPECDIQAALDKCAEDIEAVTK